MQAILQYKHDAVLLAVTPSTPNAKKGDLMISKAWRGSWGSVHSSPMERLEQRMLLTGNGDMVLQWNQTLIDAVRADKTSAGPTWASRNMAIVQAAVHDAIGAITHAYAPFLVDIQALPSTSKEAAVASAAYEALVNLYPQQKAALDAALQNSVATVARGVPKTMGILLGRAVADQILLARQSDGSDTLVSYAPGTQPGQWRPTSPGYTSALGANWGKVEPFVINSVEQFLPPPPPALNSPEYTAAYNEVKGVGAKDSTTRTAEQTQIANFWAYDRAGMGTPMVLYNQIAEDVARQQRNTLTQNAEIFGLMNLAMADAGITAWAAKYKYDVWRPITAIQEGANDGNAATVGDPTWEPLGAPGGDGPNFTPPFPAYVSGHSTFGAAAFETMKSFYGTDNIHFTAKSDELPGVTRSFNSFSQAEKENGQSRIYLGLHWQFDNQEGLKAGKAIADDVFAKLGRSGNGGIANGRGMDRGTGVQNVSGSGSNKSVVPAEVFQRFSTTPIASSGPVGAG